VREDGGGNVGGGPRVEPGVTDGPLGGGQAVRGMRFTTFTCTDSAGTGMEAFRMLMPANWQAQGGVSWPNTNPGMPAVLAFRLSDPNSSSRSTTSASSAGTSARRRTRSAT